MTHNSRCANANPRSRCECSCGGKNHGINHKDFLHENTDRGVNENLGGDIGKIIKTLTGLPFKCSCRKIQTLGNFFAYPHDSGLEDADGEKWWLFYRCTKCHYEWSWHKIMNRLKFAEEP